jgi:hypothetical protein
MHIHRCGNKPADRNVVQKEAGKEVKYKSLCIEIYEMYDYIDNKWSQRNSIKKRL